MGEWSNALNLVVVGVLSVFLALGLIWGVIAVLTRVLRPTEVPRVDEDPELERLRAARAAAVAIALADYIAEQRRMASPMARAQKPGTIPSRWLNAGRARQVAGWQPTPVRRDGYNR
ncbi:MAG: hypothetical protein Kow0047_18930 [Anaerolineae bacterium]